MEGEPFDAVVWRCVAQLPRQQARVVALFYVEDRSVEQIAALLDCSTGTIKTHLERVYAKLGVGDRTAAALMAIERGLINLR